DLVVAGASGADLLVGRVGGRPGRVADCGDVDAVAQLPELALSAPEAAEAEHGRLQPLRVRTLEGAPVDEMAGGGGGRLRAAGGRSGSAARGRAAPRQGQACRSSS